MFILDLSDLLTHSVNIRERIYCVLLTSDLQQLQLPILTSKIFKKFHHFLIQTMKIFP